jgi:peptide/nickel transport system substrate-binding protein
MRRGLCAVIAIGVGVGLGPGVGRAETRASYGGTLRAPLGDEELTGLVFDAPFRLDRAGRPRPHLALALEMPEGATRARLILRGDVRFSDGAPVTAADVAASLSRAMREPAGWVLAPIKVTRASSDTVVELELTRPTPELPLLLTTAAALVTRGGAVGLKASGTGPFVIRSADTSGVRLAANASCFAGRPYLDSLVLLAQRSRTEEVGAFELSALDVSRHGASVFPGSVQRRASTTVDGAITLTAYLAFAGVFDGDATLRRAVGLGINRERLRRLAVREPTAAAGSAAPPALGGASAHPAYDPARARALLAARPLSPTAPLNATLLVDAERFDDVDVANRLLADLSRLGIQLTIESVPSEVFRTRVDARRYDLALGLSTPPAPDGGLAELAVLAGVDPAAARARLQRAPARPGALEPQGTSESLGSDQAPKVLPLYHREARLHIGDRVRGLTVDFAGRASFADAWLK